MSLMFIFQLDRMQCSFLRTLARRSQGLLSIREGGVLLRNIQHLLIIYHCLLLLFYVFLLLITPVKQFIILVERFELYFLVRFVCRRFRQFYRKCSFNLVILIQLQYLMSNHHSIFVKFEANLYNLKY